MSPGRTVPTLAFAVASLLSTGAHAAPTVFDGTYKLNMHVVLTNALTATQAVFCELDIQGLDNLGDIFKARQIIVATMSSTKVYTCTVTVPYNWISSNPNNPTTVAISGVSTAFVYDSSLPAVQLAVSAGPVEPISVGVNQHSAFTYSTTVDLD